MLTIEEQAGRYIHNIHSSVVVGRRVDERRRRRREKRLRVEVEEVVVGGRHEDVYGLAGEWVRGEGVGEEGDRGKRVHRGHRREGGVGRGEGRK